MNQRIILLMGPTATGKTDLALALAEIFPVEIISVDSALIYRDLNIGTAKPTISQQKLVPQHLLDIISPLANYSVANFLDDSQVLIQEILARGKNVLFVGGTMMYFNALINGISTLPKSDLKIRANIEQQINTFGLNYLYQRLISLEPSSKIDQNDQQRIIRFLELYELTGQTLTQLHSLNQPQSILANYSVLPLAIIPDNRELLHKRINDRFDQMLDQGFIAEVETIKNNYPDLTINHNSMRSVGYYQAWQYLDGTIDYNTFVAKAKAASRQLAKRQVTWLRNLAQHTHALHVNSLEQKPILDKLISTIKQHLV